MFITDNEEKKRKWPELWRDVPGYEGLYKVSNHGRVKSLERKGRRQERILKPWTSDSGYLLVSLCKMGEENKSYVHRLVADAFSINRRAGQDQVDHIDGNPKNNCTWNLRYTTWRENNDNPNSPGAMKKEIPVESFNLETGETLAKYPTISAAKKDGYHPYCIHCCLSGKQHTHHGVGFRKQQIV